MFHRLLTSLSQCVTHFLLAESPFLCVSSWNLRRFSSSFDGKNGVVAPERNESHRFGHCSL